MDDTGLCKLRDSQASRSYRCIPVQGYRSVRVTYLRQRQNIGAIFQPRVVEYPCSTVLRPEYSKARKPRKHRVISHHPHRASYACIAFDFPYSHQRIQLMTVTNIHQREKFLARATVVRLSARRSRLKVRHALTGVALLGLSRAKRVDRRFLRRADATLPALRARLAEEVSTGGKNVRTHVVCQVSRKNVHRSRVGLRPRVPCYGMVVWRPSSRTSPCGVRCLVHVLPTSREMRHYPHQPSRKSVQRAEHQHAVHVAYSGYYRRASDAHPPPSVWAASCGR